MAGRKEEIYCVVMLSELSENGEILVILYMAAICAVSAV
jgi:hypothetical protein